MNDRAEADESKPLVSISTPPIRVAPMGEIRLYPISEEELEGLAEGSPSSLFLNLGLAFTSAFLSFGCTLLSAVIADIKVFVVFVVLCSVFGVAGLVLLVLSWRFRKSQDSLIAKIKRRMPASAEQDAPASLVDPE